MVVPLGGVGGGTGIQMQYQQQEDPYSMQGYYPLNPGYPPKQ